MTDLGTSRSCAGFTLVEVLVAFAILALSLTAAFSGISGSLRANRDAELARRALSLAQSKLDGIGLVEPVALGRTSGAFSNEFAWTVSARPLAQQLSPPVNGYWIEVTVSHHPQGGGRSIAPVTLKTAKLTATNGQR